MRRKLYIFINIYSVKNYSSLRRHRITKMFHKKDVKVTAVRREPNVGKEKGKVMQTTLIITWVAALTAATSLFVQSGLRK